MKSDKNSLSTNIEAVEAILVASYNTTNKCVLIINEYGVCFIRIQLKQIS